MFSKFLCRDDLITPSVKLQVFYLKFGVGQNIFDAAAHTLVETGSSLETWDGTLQLRTVKADGDALVTQEISLEIPRFRCNGCEEFRSYVIWFHCYVKCIGYAFIYLRPR